MRAPKLVVCARTREQQTKTGESLFSLFAHSRLLIYFTIFSLSLRLKQIALSLSLFFPLNLRFYFFLFLLPALRAKEKSGKKVVRQFPFLRRITIFTHTGKVGAQIKEGNSKSGRRKWCVCVPKQATELTQHTAFNVSATHTRLYCSHSLFAPTFFRLQFALKPLNRVFTLNSPLSHMT